MSELVSEGERRKGILFTFLLRDMILGSVSSNFCDES